jgi:hypothetical protein
MIEVHGHETELAQKPMIEIRGHEKEIIDGAIVLITMTIALFMYYSYLAYHGVF